MARRAFTMRLKPGAGPEYCRRHDAIWPELADLLRATGISDYTIWLGDEDMLFAILDEAEPTRAAAIGDHPIMRRWWQYMADLMETGHDDAPTVRHLHRVFEL